jgi:hypothetical protein
MCYASPVKTNQNPPDAEQTRKYMILLLRIFCLHVERLKLFASTVEPDLFRASYDSQTLLLMYQ